MNPKQHAIEMLKCKQNPLYFLHNYVYIEEVGGRVRYGEVLHPKLIRVVRVAYRYHRVVFMASRQLGKSTISAALILWAMIFYPGSKAIILNYRKEPALENIDKIKFMWSNLPEWMRFPSPSLTFSRKTYFELKNGSKVTVLYPSTVHKPNTIARSLTVPILYIDEAAFIPHLHEIYGSAQQTLSTARQQAIKHGYPYFQIITSTPNGLYSPEGNDKPNWFYDRWENAIDSDEIFIPKYDNNGNFIKEELVEQNKISTIFNSTKHNGFVKVRYHWSEDPNKDEQWYAEQCRELSDKRLINQELDLLFVGSTSCIFDDDTLAEMQPKKPIKKVGMPYGTSLHIFDNLSKKDYCLIGVDSASSLHGAYNAIEVFSFLNFNQIAELQCKLGSLNQFSEVVKAVFKYFYNIINDRIILAIENNSIGKAIIENLLNENNIDFSYYIYGDKKYQYGIQTNTQTKPLMVALLKEHAEQNPKGIHSQRLISQLSTIERTNSGTIKVAGYSDLFMAACFCAYARRKKELDILPLINEDDVNANKDVIQTMHNFAKIMSNTEFLNYKNKQNFDETANTDLSEEFTKTNTNIFMPIIF